MFQLNPTSSINCCHKYLEAGQNYQKNQPFLHQSNKSASEFSKTFYGILLSNHKNKNNKGKNKVLTDTLKVGTIFLLSNIIIYELYNVISIINKLPTHLFEMVMKVKILPTTKHQNIVFKLSNSINEVAQITHLFDTVESFKIFNIDLNERILGSYNDQDLIIGEITNHAEKSNK